MARSHTLGYKTPCPIVKLVLSSCALVTAVSRAATLSVGETPVLAGSAVSGDLQGISDTGPSLLSRAGAGGNPAPLLSTRSVSSVASSVIAGTADVPREAAAPATSAPEAQPAPSSEPARPRSQARRPAARPRTTTTTTGSGSRRQRVSEPEPESAPVRPVSSKEPAPAEPPVITPPGWSVTLSGGWASDFYFRGLNVGKRTSALGDSPDSGYSVFKLDAVYPLADGSEVRGGVSSFSSLETYYPNGVTDRVGGPGGSQFARDGRQRYNEWDFSLSYARPLIPGYLGGELGVNHFRFSDSLFWLDGSTPVDHTTEIFLQLTGRPWSGETQSLSYQVTPLLYFARDIDGFEGTYGRFNLNGDIRVKGTEWRFMPSVGVSYDWKYNGDSNDWNNLEFALGVSHPINRVTDVTLTAGYNVNLGPTNASSFPQPNNRPDVSLTDEGFFASIMFSTKIGALAQVAPEAYSGKDSPSGNDSIDFNRDRDRKERRWRVSTGSSRRTLEADFDTDTSSATFDVLNSAAFNRRTGSLAAGEDPASRIATGASDGTYRDGIVYSQSSNYGDGTADFRITNDAQVVDPNTDPASPYDRQIFFHNDRYSYTASSLSNNGSSSFNVEDDVSLPSIELAYQVTDHFSVGLSYSFARGEFDTGAFSPSAFTVRERAENYTYIYDVDPLYSVLQFPSAGANGFDTRGTGLGDVLYDGTVFARSYSADAGNPVPGPQMLTDITENEVARVGVFMNSELKVNMSEISLPISFQMSRGRFEAGLSFGPTVSIMSSELETSAYYQNLTEIERAAGSVISRSRLEDGIETPLPIDGNNLGYIGHSWTTDSVDVGSDQPHTPGAAVAGNATSPEFAPGTATASAVQPPIVPSGGSGGGRGGERGVASLPGQAVTSERVRERDTSAQFGLMAQAFIRMDLDARRIYFVEAFGRYNWVDELSLSNGIGSAKVDASSWSAGVMLGRRF